MITSWNGKPMAPGEYEQHLREKRDKEDVELQDARYRRFVKNHMKGEPDELQVQRLVAATFKRKRRMEKRRAIEARAGAPGGCKTSPDSDPNLP